MIVCTSPIYMQYPGEIHFGENILIDFEQSLQHCTPRKTKFRRTAGDKQLRAEAGQPAGRRFLKIRPPNSLRQLPCWNRLAEMPSPCDRTSGVHLFGKSGKAHTYSGWAWKCHFTSVANQVHGGGSGIAIVPPPPCREGAAAVFHTADCQRSKFLWLCWLNVYPCASRPTNMWWGRGQYT